MRKKFLTVYDYGSGGIWQYVHAEDAEQILTKYPALEIVEEEPEWLKDSQLTLREYDVEAEPDKVMAGFMKKA